MDVSADGKLLVAGTSDGQVLLFNATDATLLGTLSTDQTTAVNRIEVSPDGEWLVAVSGDVLTTWRNDP
jgi:WD40 repeat protein